MLIYNAVRGCQDDGRVNSWEDHTLWITIWAGSWDKTPTPKTLIQKMLSPTSKPQPPNSKHKNQWHFIHWRFVRGIMTGYLWAVIIRSCCSRCSIGVKEHYSEFLLIALSMNNWSIRKKGTVIQIKHVQAWASSLRSEYHSGDWFAKLNK